MSKCWVAFIIHKSLIYVACEAQSNLVKSVLPILGSIFISSDRFNLVKVVLSQRKWRLNRVFFTKNVINLQVFKILANGLQHWIGN